MRIWSICQSNKRLKPLYQWTKIELKENLNCRTPANGEKSNKKNWIFKKFIQFKIAFHLFNFVNILTALFALMVFHKNDRFEARAAKNLFFIIHTHLPLFGAVEKNKLFVFYGDTKRFEICTDAQDRIDYNVTLHVCILLRLLPIEVHAEAEQRRRWKVDRKWMWVA